LDPLDYDTERVNLLYFKYFLKNKPIMIDYNARLSAAILGVGFALVQIQPAQALTKVEVSKVAQSVTVMIQNAQNPQETGSGVIIKREGETYTVLTAHHVVPQVSDFKVLTPDKKFYPIIQSSIQPLPGVDLALVQFTSAGAYEVAKIGDSTQSPSGSTSFVAGFPATNEIRTESEYYFTSGEIAANGSRPNKDGYALAYSNPTLRGMSGGPVLNEQGELIGIHGRAEKAEQLQNSQLSNTTYVLKTEFNYAIPINTFLTLAPQVNKTLALRTPSPSVSSALSADDFFLQAEEKSKKGDYRGAITDYDQAIRLDPKLALAYNNRGFVHHRLGDHKSAIIDYDQAIRLNPKYSEAYSNRGFARYKVGDNQGAIADYDQSVRIAPESARAHNMRGVFYSRVGDNQGAIADFDQAIRLDPKYALSYKNRGVIRNEVGDNQGAIADVDQAIRLDPKYAMAYQIRGQVRYKSGDKQGAITDFDQAIRLDPKYAVAYENRGAARYGLGDYKGANADFDQAIHLDPKDAVAYNDRGNTRQLLGDKQGALADYDQAIRFDPKYAVAYRNRGVIRNKLGDKQGAIADFDQTIRLAPKNANAYYNRGVTRYELGDKQGAIADLQKAAALFKAQGDEKNYQSMLKFLQQVNGR
jgi:tetratricopeptide (TPR) repeat protein